MVRVRDTSVEQFVVALALNTALCILGILIFSLWRRKQRAFFAPRAAPADYEVMDRAEDNKSLAPIWNDGLFSWIWDTIKYPLLLALY